MPHPGALAGIRVIDLSRILAGPYCTQMLGDHGADVIKVEGPSGDETRAWGPPFPQQQSWSAYFDGLNRNKRNLELDLSSPRGHEILRLLLREADVLVENFKAGALAKWGLDDDTIRELNPRIVHCRITGFGSDGPMGRLPGYDAVLQAYCGVMSINGEPEGDPLRVGVPVVDQTTGVLAFAGILLALVERATSGLGQLVDCTLFDTALSMLHPHSASWLATGAVPQRTGSAHPTVAPYDMFEASDKRIFVGAGSNAQFRTLSEVLDIPDVARDPRFTNNADRIEHVSELRALLVAAISHRQADELATELLARGVPASPVNDIGAALTAPHTMFRNMVVEVDGHRGIGIPIVLDRTPGSVRTAPRHLGQDTEAILSLLGLPEGQAEGSSPSAKMPSGSAAIT